MGTLREELERAQAKLSDENGSEATEESAQQVETSEAASAQDTEAAAEPASGEGGAEQTSGSLQRDEKGKFLPKGKEEEKPQQQAKVVKPGPSKQGQAVATTQGTQTQAVNTVKAPQSWKATERELFGKLPPEAQAVVNRRETEINRALQEAAPARQAAQKWSEVTAPFEAMVRSSGGDMHGTVDNLLRTQYALHTAPPHGKAQIVANIISQFGVDPAAVASFLQGQPAQQQQHGFDPNQFAQQLEQRIVGRFEQQQNTARVQHEIQRLSQFEAEHEFVDDLREPMAKLLEAGLADDWEDAYAKAATLHPDVSRALAQRQEAQRANASRASTFRAKAAGASLRSTPAGPSGQAKPSDLRGILESAWNEKSGQER